VVDPVLANPEPVQEYEPGTWGPQSAAAIMSGEGWHDPVKEQTLPC
jgi:glucose-6-phosphate 1-dehydrogenase